MKRPAREVLGLREVILVLTFVFGAWVWLWILAQVALRWGETIITLVVVIWVVYMLIFTSRFVVTRWRERREKQSDSARRARIQSALDAARRERDYDRRADDARYRALS